MYPIVMIAKRLLTNDDAKGDQSRNLAYSYLHLEYRIFTMITCNVKQPRLKRMRKETLLHIKLPQSHVAFSLQEMLVNQVEKCSSRVNQSRNQLKSTTTRRVENYMLGMFVYGTHPCNHADALFHIR